MLWRIDPLLGNARNIHAANNTGAMFSVVRAWTVAMQRTLTLNTFSRTWWHHTQTERLFSAVVRTECLYRIEGVFCGPRHASVLVMDQWTSSMTPDVLSAWSVPSLYNVKSVAKRDERISIGELDRVLEGRQSKVIEQEMARRLHSDLKW
jgi:hypothetical protein